MRRFAFHTDLIPVGKIWIQLFFLQQLVNSRTSWALNLLYGNWYRRRKYLNPNLLNLASKMTLYRILLAWRVCINIPPHNYTHIFIYTRIYVCACVYMCVYICIFIYTHTFVCISIYIYICVYTCICVCMYIHIYMYVYIYIYLYTCTSVCVYIYIYIYICRERQRNGGFCKSD